MQYGIKLGFKLVMTHVESTNDDAHLHNIEWLEKFPLITPHWEVENIRFQSLDQQLPQTPISMIHTLWSWFAIVNLLKLLMLESIG